MTRHAPLPSTQLTTLLSALLATLLGCGDADGGAQASASASANTGPTLVFEAAENQAKTASSVKAAPAASPVVQIPAGEFAFGSMPGDRGRNPALEPVVEIVSMGAFDIDRLPYPNEVGAPPTFASRDKARSLCEAKGRRLCTEPEWERACKGPENNEYAGQPAWDPACTDKPSSCASGFGVLSMGGLREWTAGVVEGPDKKLAVTRGAPKAGGGEVDRRCAARKPLEQSAGDATFRCCGGDANERAIVEPAAKPSFEKTSMPAAELAKIFENVPELKKLSGGVKFFDEETAKKEVVARAKDADTKGYELTTSPLVWRPERGEELLLFVGQSGDDAFILALYPLPGGKHRVASSLILKREPLPVVFAVDRSVNTRLQWATCFMCPSESGKITYRDDRRVIITQE